MADASTPKAGSAHQEIKTESMINVTVKKKKKKLLQLQEYIFSPIMNVLFSRGQ